MTFKSTGGGGTVKGVGLYFADIILIYLSATFINITGMVTEF